MKFRPSVQRLIDYQDVRNVDGSINARRWQQFLFELNSVISTPDATRRAEAAPAVSPGPPSSGGGDVVGPASATNDAIALFDGTTGKLIKNSVVTIGGGGNIVTPGSITANNISGVNTGDQDLWRTFNADTGSATATTTASTFTIAGGTDISTTISGNTLTIAYTGLPPGLQNLVETFSGDTGSFTSLTPTDTLNILGGTDIATSVSGNNLTIDFVGSIPGPQNLIETVTGDSGTFTAATPTDTLNVAGGTDIATSVSGNTLTIGFTGSIPAPVIGANPTAQVNGTAVNGSATTFMRSDAAPALANPVIPASGTQGFTGNVTASGRVQGTATGTGTAASGVIGLAVGPNRIGVYGENDNANTGAVFGQNFSTGNFQGLLNGSGVRGVGFVGVAGEATGVSGNGKCGVFGFAQNQGSAATPSYGGYFRTQNTGTTVNGIAVAARLIGNGTIGLLYQGLNGTTETFAVRRDGQITSSAGATLEGNLVVNGNSTLGDSSADTVLMNAGTFNAPNLPSVTPNRLVVMNASNQVGTEPFTTLTDKADRAAAGSPGRVLVSDALGNPVIAGANVQATASGFLAPIGSVPPGQLAYSFVGRTNQGMFSSSTSGIGLRSSSTRGIDLTDLSLAPATDNTQTCGTNGAAFQRFFSNNATLAAPAYTFAGRDAQGMYSVSTTAIGLRASSTRGIEISNTALNPQNNDTQTCGTDALGFRRFFANFGTATEPAYTFAGRSYQGLSSVGNSAVAFSVSTAPGTGYEFNQDGILPLANGVRTLGAAGLRWAEIWSDAPNRASDGRPVLRNNSTGRFEVPTTVSSGVVYFDDPVNGVQLSLTFVNGILTGLDVN